MFPFTRVPFRVPIFDPQPFVSGFKGLFAAAVPGGYSFGQIPGSVGRGAHFGVRPAPSSPPLGSNRFQPKEHDAESSVGMTWGFSPKSHGNWGQNE